MPKSILKNSKKVMKGNKIKKLLNWIFIVTLLLCICATVDYADDVDSIVVTENQTQPKVSENLTLVNGAYFDTSDRDLGVAKLQGVVVERPKLPLITIVAKPSCSCKNPYKWHKRTFIDYCPYCRKYGVLTNLHKHPARFEQEISCGKCRADFCGVCGKEKYSWSHRYLRKA